MGVLLALVFAFALQTWASALPTTTTLAVTAKPAVSRPVTILVATVTDPNPVLHGQVRFYDGQMLIGSAQLVSTGTKYTHGTANLAMQLAPGSHVLKAVFPGTTKDASSSSITHTFAVAGALSSTTISSTGSPTNYTLTAQVGGSGLNIPTGQVSFTDQTNSNALLGTATLVAGKGTNKFSNATSYPTYDPTDYGEPYMVAAADFNGDGILDLADADYNSTISIHLGKGDGTFQPAAPFCTHGAPAVPCDIGSEATSIAVGDFNNDGIPDLVIAAGSGSEVDVLIGNGDGTFQQEVIYSTASGNTNVIVGDLNNDGVQDLVVSIDGGFSILLGNGDGSFQSHNEISTSDASTYITLGDFNKDGILDIASAGWNGSDLMVFLGNGNGTFKAEKDTPIDVNTADCTVKAVDLKGTGFLSDIALCGSGILEALVGNGDGTFKTPVELQPNGTTEETVSSLVAADLDGDGKVDLAVSWYSDTSLPGSVSVFKGAGDGTFNATPTKLTVGKYPIYILAADLDGEGDPDLVTANEYSNDLSVMLDSATQIASASLSNVTIPGTGLHYVFASYPGDAAHAQSQSVTIGLTANGAVAPSLTSIAPTSANAGSGAFTLTVTGKNFVSGAVVKWAGSARATTFVSATSLTASILAADVASQGTYPVTVTSGGATTGAATFTVSAVVVAPVISSLSPPSAVAGGPSFSLTVTGANFTAGSTVNWNGAARGTSFTSATQVVAVILAADIAAIGSNTVTVSTGSSKSNSLSFAVTAAPPVVASLSPNYAIVGSAAFTMKVGGSGFASTASVYWGATKLTTTYVSAIQLTASVPAANLATIGTFPVTVVNTGSVTSNAVGFTVAAATHTPLAYGAFSKDGSPGANSGNIVCLWTSPQYTCTITGENFSGFQYVVHVTPASTSAPVIPTVSAAAGNINVEMFNMAGTGIQSPFYITVYKP